MSLNLIFFFPFSHSFPLRVFFTYSWGDEKLFCLKALFTFHTFAAVHNVVRKVKKKQAKKLFVHCMKKKSFCLKCKLMGKINFPQPTTSERFSLHRVCGKKKVSSDFLSSCCWLRGAYYLCMLRVKEKIFFIRSRSVWMFMFQNNNLFESVSQRFSIHKRRFFHVRYSISFYVVAWTNEEESICLSSDIYEEAKRR